MPDNNSPDGDTVQSKSDEASSLEDRSWASFTPRHQSFISSDLDAKKVCDHLTPVTPPCPTQINLGA